MATPELTAASATIATGSSSQLARAWVVDPGAGTPAEVMGGFAWALIPLAVGTAIFALGLWVFSREAPGIAERL